MVEGTRGVFDATQPIRSDFIRTLSGAIGRRVRKDDTILPWELDRLAHRPLDNIVDLYEQSMPKVDIRVGSIELTPAKADEERVLTSDENSSRSFTLHPGDPYWEMDFTPFGTAVREADLVAPGLYLGSVDLQRLIDSRRDDPDVPELLVGDANPAMARFAARHLGFGRTDSLEGEGLSTLFIPRDELFSEASRARCVNTRKLLYGRAVSSGSARGTEEAYEKDLRILGIKRNLAYQGLHMD